MSAARRRPRTTGEPIFTPNVRWLLLSAGALAVLIFVLMVGH